MSEFDFVMQDFLLEADPVLERKLNEPIPKHVEPMSCMRGLVMYD